MPSEFLLPLFALTLLANAFLVAAAIRGMRRGQTDHRPSGKTRPAEGPSAPRSSAMRWSGPDDAGQPMLTDELARAIAARRTFLDEAPPGPEDAAEPSPTPGPEPRTAPIEAAVSDPPSTPAASPKRRRTPRAGVTPSASPSVETHGTTGAAERVSGEPRRRSRRRFSLPPLDDDHEKVNRSIESFFGGIEESGDVESSRGAQTSSGGATTVALVAVGGLPDLAATAVAAGRRNSVASAETDEVAMTLAMIEQTLRGAARGNDVVTVDGRGRYRVVLAATGELAARAYLRRIRTTVEPLLEATNQPLRLAVATATVLGEAIEDAVRRAEQRLTVALAAGPPGEKAVVVEAEDGATPTPRVAPD